ncbi:hypothetical protein [Croceicoccus sp. Ery15]|uniref:hypothetical protein n=1 Tax=Croceicoccus sp. Ery15 TaxID=1703338 RepID=UPI001E41C126|nr:hypothetical protein [Croceicoccus sp. Ery15]
MVITLFHDAGDDTYAFATEGDFYPTIESLGFSPAVCGQRISIEAVEARSTTASGGKLDHFQLFTFLDAAKAAGAKKVGWY